MKHSSPSSDSPRPNSVLIQQRGLSLVEIAIAITLVAGLVVGGLVWVERIRIDQQLNSTRNDMVASMNAAVAAYANLANTNGATPRVLSGQNVWPRNRVVNPGTANVIVQGHFKGSREFMWSNTVAWGLMAAGSGFVYHLTNVPQQACAQLVHTLATVPLSFRIWAGDFRANPNNGAAPAGLTLLRANNTVALNMQDVSNACGAGANYKHIAVAFFKA